MNLSTHRLESLSVDELSALYDRVRLVLSQKIEREKRKLEETLTSLNKGLGAERHANGGVRQAASSRTTQRRKYPPVQPKYRNPNDRSQTWAGRGKQPRWLVAYLKAGKKIEDFLIKPKAGARGGHG